MSNFYDQLCESFIRPSRQIYNAYDLGQPVNKNGKRLDFQVCNNRQQKIMCSFFSNSHHPFAPCLVYLHSLNGSRLESLSFAHQALQKGFNFCSFDFSGTGLSQGKYVSLGFFQKYDIQAVLDYVCEKFSMKKFVLWGRSMGAAAAIKFLSMISNQKNKRPQYEINGLILDSPFHSLSQITIQIAKERINMPQILIKVVLMMVKSNLEQKVGFKLSEMQLLEDIKIIKCPVLLLTSKNDKLVDSSQSEKIYETISHKDREIVFIKGEHNSNRQVQTIEYIFKFVAQSIKVNKLGKDPVLVKSSKLLHYRQKNTMGGSYVLSPHTSNKIKNNSFENNKYDTCADEQIQSMRWDEQLTGQSQRGTKIRLPKKQPYLCSPKIKFSDKKIESMTQHKINFKEKRFNFHQLCGEGEKKIDYFGQKKFESAQKPCLQINKSPIKEPPKVNIERRTATDQSASKTPDKINQFSMKNYRQKFAQSDKRELKYCPISTNQIFENASETLDVNHFNVINEKLKKKKKKECSPMIKICGAKRNISVSMERKSELSTKAPPELLRLKYPSKFI